MSWLDIWRRIDPRTAKAASDALARAFDSATFWVPASEGDRRTKAEGDAS